MARLSSELILRLVDRVSGPAAGIGGRLRALNGQVDRMNRGHMAAMAPMRGFAGRLLAYGGAYLGVSQGIESTVGSARNMQAALTEIGIKSGLGGAQLNGLRDRMMKLAPATNQFTSDLLGGVDTMVTMGLAVNDAADAMPAIGKTATATKSSITDLSAATVAAMQNMNVASGQVGQMLDSMTSAGNAGAFEMRDMATYFPQLTASAKSLGMEGVKGVSDMAAALQIARRGAGDASTAANNMANFLGKIMSPEVAKRFKKFGVDVTKELKKAHKQGISPIEHFIKLVDEKTKGGQADLLGQLFGDKQVLDFVRPMLSDFKDYLRIREEAEKASGTVAEAYARRMQDANERLKALQLRIQNSATIIGAGLLEPIAGVADYFSAIFDTIDKRVTVFDRLGSAFSGFMGGLGFEGSAGGLKALGDMIFGIAGPDGVAAGEELGAIAAKFRSFGESIRAISDSVKDSALGSFLGSISGYGVGLAVTAIGIGLVGGAVRSLAAALYLLSGAKAAVGILKFLAKGGGWLVNAKKIAGGAAEIKPPTAAPEPAGGAGTPKAGGGVRPSFGGALRGLLSTGTIVQTLALAAGESLIDGFMERLNSKLDETFPEIYNPESRAKAEEARQKGLWQLWKEVLPSDLTRPIGDLQAPVQDEYPPRTKGGVSDVGRVPMGPPPDIVGQLRSTTLQTRQTGTADVNVTNPIRPNVTINSPVTVNVQSGADPDAIAAAVAARTGESNRAAVEAALVGAYA